MSVLQEIVAANRAGERRGIGSVCSAHPLVLEVAVEAALADGRPLLVEATCNQVNQEGGYTGMQAADFRAFVTGLARTRGLPEGRLILGGDHLGPNPWRAEPADAALAKAELLVRSYAEAGFAKIHLDASMACAGDPDPLPPELIAARAAPFGNFTAAMRKDTDQFDVTARFRFTREQTLETMLQADPLATSVRELK